MPLRTRKTLQAEQFSAVGGKPKTSAHCAYTGKTADSAIAHLEYVLSVADATAVMPPGYWLARGAELAAVPTLTPTQRARLARILLQIDQPTRAVALCRKAA
jgi:hypothetical protein